jgi:hypothetical protein
MTESVIFLVGENNEKHGEVTVGEDEVYWEYTGPDPRDEVRDYLKRVEDKTEYDLHEEVRDDIQDEDGSSFNEMYLMEMYKILDYLDYPHRAYLN